VWDLRNVTKPLDQGAFGNGKSVQKLYYDNELSLLYGSGKGS